MTASRIRSWATPCDRACRTTKPDRPSSATARSDRESSQPNTPAHSETASGRVVTARSASTRLASLPRPARFTLSSPRASTPIQNGEPFARDQSSAARSGLESGATCLTSCTASSRSRGPSSILVTRSVPSSLINESQNTIVSCDDRPAAITINSVCSVTAVRTR